METKHTPKSPTQSGNNPNPSKPEKTKSTPGGTDGKKPDPRSQPPASQPKTL